MKIAILGLGAYAIALAKVLHSSGKEIVMWSKFEDEANMVRSSRANSATLPDIFLPDDIDITTDLKKCTNRAEIIIIAVPMFAVRGVCCSLKEMLDKNQIICIVSKGVEKGTYMFPSQVVMEEIPDCNKVCMISGPSFAAELAELSETGLTIASESDEVIYKVSDAFKCSNLYFDYTNDILGTQICATVKNIYAILLGILSGQNKSESTKASTLAIIINDSRKLLEILGGNRKTAYMFAGLGDLLLTCMSSKSRNFTLGTCLGKGMSVSDALNSISAKTVEGLHSLESIHELLKITGNSVKSIDLMYNVIYNGASVDKVLGAIVD